MLITKPKQTRLILLNSDVNPSKRSLTPYKLRQFHSQKASKKSIKESKIKIKIFKEMKNLIKKWKSAFLKEILFMKQKNLKKSPVIAISNIRILTFSGNLEAQKRRIVLKLIPKFLSMKIQSNLISFNSINSMSNKSV
jgi:hypothetical protein